MLGTGGRNRLASLNATTHDRWMPAPIRDMNVREYGDDYKSVGSLKTTLSLSNKGIAPKKRLMDARNTHSHRLIFASSDHLQSDLVSTTSRHSTASVKSTNISQMHKRQRCQFSESCQKRGF